MADINDPIDWALDANGDLEIDLTNGQGLRFTTGLEAVSQNINLAITLFKGEWFMDRERGVGYYQEILGHKFHQATVIEAYRIVIAAVPDVTEITKLTASFDGATRTVTVTWGVLTPFGTTNGSTTV